MRNKVFGYVVGWLCLTLAGICAADDFRQSARIAARWAIETQNAPVLASSLAVLIDRGGTLDDGDPFGVATLAHALREMPGGVALMEDLLANRARGQIGGARRMDVLIGPGQSHEAKLVLVAAELSWIEARLWRGANEADIELDLIGPDGATLAADRGPETGIEGVAALLDVWMETCTNVTLRVTNTGASEGRVAIFVPISPRQDCEAPG